MTMHAGRLLLFALVVAFALCDSSRASTDVKLDRDAPEDCTAAIKLAGVPDSFGTGASHIDSKFDPLRAINRCKQAVMQNMEDMTAPGFLAEAFALAGDTTAATRALALQVARYNGVGSPAFAKHPALVQKLRSLANREPEAQVALAFLYRLGAGVGKDESKAISWFERAARSGDPEGRFQYGLHLLKLARAKPADAQAKTWRRDAEAMLRAAVAQCHPLAGWELATSVDGLNADEASRQYDLLDARRGNLTAQLSMVGRLTKGERSQESFIEALAWMSIVDEHWPQDWGPARSLRERLSDVTLKKVHEMVERLKASMCHPIGFRSALGAQ